MGSVFISYAHEDEDKARKIKTRLDELGFETWIDRSAPASRDDISTVIDARLESVDSVLVLWSPQSRDSVWVRAEALKGLESNKYLGLLLSSLVPPVPFNALAAPDLSEWTGLSEHYGWDALIRGLANVSPRGAEIIDRHNVALAAELAERDRLAAQQPPLPLIVTEEQELDTRPPFSDVDTIIAAAKSILGGSGKLDLFNALTQSALDIEMLRDAAFVVSADIDLQRPTGSDFTIVPTLSAALAAANDGDLIVVTKGRYDECVRVVNKVRIVGLGIGANRPVLAANSAQTALTLCEAARVENLSIETRHRAYAVHCERGAPAILKCDIRRFAEARNDLDGALYIAGKANPIVIATSVASTGCTAIYTVDRSGGQFLGATIVALRGSGVTCRGRPEFLGCKIEAIGSHAVRVQTNGAPVLEGCDISGRGAPVIYVRGQGYPRIKESRVNAIRQLAFDFDEAASGRYEANIVSVERGDQAGTGRTIEGGFFARFKSREASLVSSALRQQEFAKLRGKGKPLFIANIAPDGTALPSPV